MERIIQNQNNSRFIQKKKKNTLLPRSIIPLKLIPYITILVSRKHAQKKRKNEKEREKKKNKSRNKAKHASITSSRHPLVHTPSLPVSPFPQSVPD